VNFTFPGGCHVAEVEIDPDTGELALVAYTAVDDVGVVLNPMIVEGQVHGGVVQAWARHWARPASMTRRAASSSPARFIITAFRARMTCRTCGVYSEHPLPA
jgi:xanthine dehydrogenase molybdopterin-binding subunit B